MRWAIIAIVLATPGALAQETDDAGAAHAAAFQPADLETLGACEARISGNDWLVAEFSDWLAAEGQTESLGHIRRAQELGGPLKAQLNQLRFDAASVADVSPEPSEDAFARTLTSFARRPGESNVDAYTRLQPETRLPEACFSAIERAKWKVMLAAEEE